jgi:hypothetical protein
MWTIDRDPRRLAYTIWTACAPEEVLTVRTYGDTSQAGTPLP